MRVILRQSVPNLGRTGDVINVRNGYARNFLLPKGLVAFADERNVQAFEHVKKQLDKKRAKEKVGAEEVAAKMSEYSCTIARKVGEKDKLFGSVTTQDIANELNKAGFSVDKRDIHLNDPIKSLGVHSVEIKLLPEVVATVKVWVVKEE